jgi:hypothetical protein
MAVVLALVTVAWSATAGTSRVITINDHFRCYRYQPTPGDLDVDDIEVRNVWSNAEENISTAVLCEDLDGNGVNELVFGTDRGRLISVELGTWYEVVKEKMTDVEIHSLAIGNLDDKDDLEVAITAADGVHCYDVGKGKRTWTRLYQTFDSDVQLVPARTEPGELQRSDVLVLRTKGSSLTGTDHIIIRIDGEGEELYKVRLQEKEGRPALRASWVVADLDRDNDLDIFVSDRGHPGIGATGLGKNIWLAEASNGTVVDSWVIRHATLASRPMLVVSDGRKYVAIGMDQGLGTADVNDLVLFDGVDRTFLYMDVYDNADIVSWQYLTYIPDATSGTIVMSSSNWNMHAFHLMNTSASWTRKFSGAGLGTIPVACDIDDDGQTELLCPGGGITFVDVLSGQVEGRYQPQRGTPISIVMTVGDIDDDDVSETVFGYYESDQTHIYSLLILGDVASVEIEPPIDPIWSWVVLICVVGTILILTVDLFYTRKRRAEQEDD